MHELFVNIIGTILGGLLLTFILFFSNSYVFKKANFTGEWKAIIKIETTSYNPFKNLGIEFKIHLIQKGYELSGSGEKIRDIYLDGREVIYLREKRVVIKIDGYYEKKYFGKSKIFLNISEEGRKRDSRVTYIMKVDNNNNLKGNFISTAGDSKGKVEMSKE